MLTFTTSSLLSISNCFFLLTNFCLLFLSHCSHLLICFFSVFWCHSSCNHTVCVSAYRFPYRDLVENVLEPGHILTPGPLRTADGCRGIKHSVLNLRRHSQKVRWLWLDGLCGFIFMLVTFVPCPGHLPLMMEK